MINKHFNENASVAYLAAALLFSLLFSSIAIAWFVGEMGINANVDELQVPMGLSSYSSEQNYIGGTYDLETLDRTGHTEWIYYENVGLALKVLSGDLSTLYIKFINPNSANVVTNHYKINNTVEKPYVIILEGNNGFSNNMLIVTDAGFYTTSHTIDGSILSTNEFFSYPNAAKTHNADITTAYTRGLKSCPLFQTCSITKQPSLTFSFNGVQFSTNNLNMPEGQTTTQYYGGIAGINTQISGMYLLSSEGLTLETFSTDNNIQTDGSIAKDPLSMIASFIETVLIIIVWNLPSEIMPPILNVILIKTQAVALLVCVVVIIRGGGI